MMLTMEWGDVTLWYFCAVAAAVFFLRSRVATLSSTHRGHTGSSAFRATHKFVPSSHITSPSLNMEGRALCGRFHATKRGRARFPVPPLFASPSGEDQGDFSHASSLRSSLLPVTNSDDQLSTSSNHFEPSPFRNIGALASKKALARSAAAAATFATAAIPTVASAARTATRKKASKAAASNRMAAYIYAVFAPIFVYLNVRESKKRHAREMDRVRGAIDAMEEQRKEFMDVQGKASSDEDIFASLRDRTDQLNTEADNQVASTDAPEAAPLVEDLEMGDALAAEASMSLEGGGDDVEDDERLRGARDDGVDGVDAEDGEADDGTGGPALASDEDIERLKRMFGNS